MIGFISYSLGGMVFLLLAVWLFFSWKGHLKGGLLLLAVVATTIWLGCSVIHTTYYIPEILHFVELFHTLAWLLFLFNILRPSNGQRWVAPVFRPFVKLVSLAFISLVVIDIYQLVRGTQLLPDVWVFEHILLTITGLVLVEQSFRNARKDKRWALKYLMLGLGGLFAYDFFLYSDAMLFKHMDYIFWVARGLVYALVVPFIAVSAARQPDWSLDVFMSRAVVFHGASLAGAGLYLIVMASAGYYVRIYGGTWGTVIQVAFLFAALMLLLVMMSSGRMRAVAKVHINKHFFNYKYDYRQEWLRFINTISLSDTETGLRERTILAIAQIVDSPGGSLWLRDAENNYQVVARYNEMDELTESFAADSTVSSFLADKGWIVDLHQYRADSSQYDELVLPDWLVALRHHRLLLPLLHGDDLLGMILLQQPHSNPQINWEDHDLLKTVGRQAAGYLALMQLSEELGESRQFEAFNRLSAFVVHDLKNVVAQLSLVTINAKRHKNNPAFIEDAFSTVENAVERMNRMLGHFRKDRREGVSKELVNLASVLQLVCTRRAVARPIPVLTCPVDTIGLVQGEKERLAAVLEHMVQNAQDATPADGMVGLRLAINDDFAMIEVVDTGCGMDEDFIRNRLFKPFDTTKGNAGMGIGVYETREYIQSLGGKITVSSSPGQGTMFSISLPLSKGIE